MAAPLFPSESLRFLLNPDFFISSLFLHFGTQHLHVKKSINYMIIYSSKHLSRYCD